MKKFLINLLAVLCCIHNVFGQQNNRRLVCYYDSESSLRPGNAYFKQHYLEDALKFCTHLVYGYAGLKRGTYNLFSLDEDRDAFHYRQITAMKSRYPKLKIYLSLGGDKDIDGVDPEKYLHFLEGGKTGYQNFISSATNLLKANKFDGLDLAFQFPRNRPRKVHSKIGSSWNKFQNLFRKEPPVDPKADTHKKQFTEFTKELRDAFDKANLTVTLTVLPNVNATWFFDISSIYNNFEYINLFAFDFLTPERNPKEADYTAPIYFKNGENRLPYYNVEYQVDHWLRNGCPANKLNLGIATYARTWKLTKKSGSACKPVVKNTKGPAEFGSQWQNAGILSWPEMCGYIDSIPTVNNKDPDSVLHVIIDTDHKYGNYAFRSADAKHEYGVWASFDDPDFAGFKASYAKQKGLGGAAIYDLSYDDFRGLCSKRNFPILRSIRKGLK